MTNPIPSPTDSETVSAEPAPITEESLVVIEQCYEKACDEVADLCEGNHQWRMSIPANPDRDSDIIISLALASIPALITEVRELQAENEKLRGEIDVRSCVEEPVCSNCGEGIGPYCEDCENKA